MIPKLVILCFWCCSTILAQQNNHTLASQPSDEEQFQHHFFEGLKQKGIENYDKAIISFTQCASLFSDRAVVFYELGDLYFKTKSYLRSEGNLQKAIVLDSSNFWYKEKLYHLYIDRQFYDQAIEAVKPLLYKNKDYEEDLVNLYVDTGRFEDALKQIHVLDDRYGYTPQRDQTRVEIYKQTNNRKAHLEFLEDRLKRAPENPKHFLNLIYALSQYNLKQKAFKTAESFLAKHPKSHIAHVGLYKFYLDAGQYEKAIASLKVVTSSNILEPHLKLKVLRDFMQFVKENPEFEHVFLDLQPADSLDRSNRSNMEWAQYYQQQNNVLKAIEYLEKALSEFPDNLEAISSLATLYLDNEQYLNAANFTTSKLELYPTQLELYVVYGKSMMAQNKGAEALVILEMGLDFIFEDSDIVFQYYALMADLYRSINNIEKSKAFTNKIKALQRE